MCGQLGLNSDYAFWTLSHLVISTRVLICMQCIKSKEDILVSFSVKVQTHVLNIGPPRIYYNFSCKCTFQQSSLHVAGKTFLSSRSYLNFSQEIVCFMQLLLPNGLNQANKSPVINYGLKWSSKKGFPLIYSV